MCAVPIPSLFSSPSPLYPLPPPHPPPYIPLSTFASYGLSSIKGTLSPQDLCMYYSLCLKCSFLDMHCLLTSFAILSPSSHTVINCNSLFTQQSLPCSIFSTELCHHLRCCIFLKMLKMCILSVSPCLKNVNYLKGRDFVSGYSVFHS